MSEPDAEGEVAGTLRPLQAAAVTYCVAFGPHAGHEVVTIGVAMPREGTAGQLLRADIDGFNLHAAMRVEPNDRQRLEQLCRYLTQLALSAERVQRNTGGQLELKLKTPWRGGITRPLMSPLEVMQRLASLVRSLCRPGAGCLRDASRERLVRGDRLRPVRVADGSSAGPRGRQPNGGCKSHTGPSRPADRYVLLSGQPARSGERFLTAKTGPW